jgi:hypothetical protein
MRTEVVGEDIGCIFRGPDITDSSCSASAEENVSDALSQNEPPCPIPVFLFNR